MKDALQADYILQREATVTCPLSRVFDFFSKELELWHPPQNL